MVAQELVKKLDKIKAKIFKYKNAAFLASLLCNTKVKIEPELKALACTNGVEILISEQALKEYPEEYIITLLTHELWHIARLHNIRQGTREPELWNRVCDLVINNFLYDEDYKGIEEMKGILDINVDRQYAEEQLYDIYYEDNDKELEDRLKDLVQEGDPDFDKFEDNNKSQAVLEKKQINHIQAALELIKNIGNEEINNVRDTLKKTLEPKVNWKKALKNFMTDVFNTTSSWSIRSRRYPNIYMPGKIQEEGQLTHLAFFIDTSGSVFEEELTQFLTEIKKIYKEFHPNKMTIMQFDTDIRSEDVIYDKWKDIKFKGGGGTSLTHVHEWIQKNKPTAAVIFTDLNCYPMEYTKVPIIWIIINNPNCNANFGKNIHITI